MTTRRTPRQRQSEPEMTARESFEDAPTCQQCSRAIYLSDGCEWPDDLADCLCQECTTAKLHRALSLLRRMPLPNAMNRVTISEDWLQERRALLKL